MSILISSWLKDECNFTILNWLQPWVEQISTPICNYSICPYKCNLNCPNSLFMHRKKKKYMCRSGHFYLIAVNTIFSPVLAYQFSHVMKQHANSFPPNSFSALYIGSKRSKFSKKCNLLKSQIIFHCIKYVHSTQADFYSAQFIYSIGWFLFYCKWDILSAAAVHVYLSNIMRAMLDWCDRNPCELD